MQLQALLTSYLAQVEGGCPLTILYKATSERSRQAYNKLKTEFGRSTFIFLEETDFNQQVKIWLSMQSADRVFFLTDDAIFLDAFALADVFEFNPLNEIVSFTKGRDLLYCFTMDVKQELPAFLQEDIGGKGLNAWIWDSAPDSPDWSYPLSVDGHILLREEMMCIANEITFRNPNSLEANMQLFKPFFLSRRGICYDKVKLVNIPCNLVQSDFNNRSTGYYSSEELLQLWDEGKAIDVAKFYGLTAFEAEHSKYSFCTR
ncbi:MAG TPA: hypothetical protein VFL47_06965 [Flavisolibacter sp.]|nr:hypothetical protein [Flavisolibacter sp.]